MRIRYGTLQTHRTVKMAQGFIGIEMDQGNSVAAFEMKNHF